MVSGEVLSQCSWGISCVASSMGSKFVPKSLGASKHFPVESALDISHSEDIREVCLEVIWADFKSSPVLLPCVCPWFFAVRLLMQIRHGQLVGWSTRVWRSLVGSTTCLFGVHILMIFSLPFAFSLFPVPRLVETSDDSFCCSVLRPLVLFALLKNAFLGGSADNEGL